MPTQNMDQGGKKRTKTTPPKKGPVSASIDLTTTDTNNKILHDPFPLVFEKSVLKSEPTLNESRYSTAPDISYMAEDYAKQMLTIMNDLRKVKKFCNVVLTVNETEILAHKSVLAASSTFFRAMFDNKQAEGPSATVNISGIAETIVRQLVEFAYSGSITVGKDNVKEMLRGASSLKFLPVRDACTDFLERHISPSNSVGIRYFALLEDCGDLVKKAEDFIARNFTDVAKSEEFFMLTSSQVQEILSLQIYPFRNEQAIAIAVFCWMNHDLDNRKRFFKDLFKQIKLEMLPAPFIMSNLLHNELVNECQETRETVLLTVAKLKLLSEDVSKVTLDSVLASSEPTIIQPVPVMPVIPKRVNGSPSRKRANSQLTSPPNKINLDNGSAFKRKTPTKSPATVAEVTRAEPTTESKTRKPGSENHVHLGLTPITSLRESVKTSDLIPSVPHPREIVITPSVTTTRSDNHRVTSREKSNHVSRSHALRGNHEQGGGKVGMVGREKEGKFVRRPGDAMFVVGGACNVNMADAINKVEYYSPKSDEWYEAGPLKKSRSLVGVTVLRGTLYAVGGFDGISPIDSVECYNQATNTWSCMGRMISARRGAGVTTLNNKIYAVGGYDGTKLLSLSEVYHDNTNSWEPIAPLQTCRFALGAAALDSKVFAVGGFDGHSHLSTVEMYDPYTNTWKNVASMSMSRYAVGVTALNNTIYAVGGLDGTRPLATVERYDPRADTWSAVCDMDTQRAGVDVTVLNDDLYSAGGILGSSPLQTVEKLEIRMNKWVYVSKMSVPRVDAGAGSITII